MARKMEPLSTGADSSEDDIELEDDSDDLSSSSRMTASSRTQLGFEFEDDSDKAHYVIVLPHITELHEESLEECQDDADDLWGNIFLEPMVAPKPEGLDEMTKREFHDAVRETLMDILQGPQCGFTCTAYETRDGKEVILRILLESPNAQRVIAEREHIRVPLTPEAYSSYGRQKCASDPEEYDPEEYVPTASFERGKFVKTATPVVGYVTYSMKTQPIVKRDFGEIDCIRMVRRAMTTFICMDSLVASGVANQAFPPHTHDILTEMHKAGWNDWTAVLQWPGPKHVDKVREYFGEEFGFFFHWFNFFNRYLIYAGVLAGLTMIVAYGFFDAAEDDHEIPENYPLFAFPTGNYPRPYIRLGFSLFMCLWGSVYTKHYQRRSNFKVMEWGMNKYENSAQVRGAYSKEYRGSTRDRMQRAAHWILAFIVIAETFVVVWLVSVFRNNLAQRERRFFGMTAKTAKRVIPNLIVTANIKCVDWLWKWGSPKLSEKENWRTNQELKTSKVVKMFLVKFFVYYYPFLFIAFLQQSWYGMDADSCMADLRQQLLVYYPIEVAFTIFDTIFTVARARFSAKRRLGSVSGKLYHTELQAKLPAYDGEIEDTMELILGFGFMMMFAPVLLVLPLLALVAYIFQIRLLAYRLSFANQRPSPRGQEGFGAWADIVNFITFAGVMCNAGLIVFMMKPLRSLPIHHKLAWFLLIEHTLVVVKLLISACPSKTESQKFIEEYNVQVVPDIEEQSMRERFGAGPADKIDVNDGVPKIDVKFDDPGLLPRENSKESSRSSLSTASSSIASSS